ncbi:MAG: hotdog fold thioesterase [bacterium]|nr:hotdog fold thioesterase [bacterium]
MDEQIKSAIGARFEQEPFAQRCGVSLIDLAEGYARVEMTCTPEMENIFGMVHGGAIFSLADEAFQLACNTSGTVTVALSVTMNYHSAPPVGSRLSAEARLISQTRKTGNYNITVSTQEGVLVATCLALAYRKGDPLPFL